MCLDINIMSRYIAKTMYLQKQKWLIIWNGGSSNLYLLFRKFCLNIVFLSSDGIYGSSLKNASCCKKISPIQTKIYNRQTNILLFFLDWRRKQIIWQGVLFIWWSHVDGHQTVELCIKNWIFLNYLIWRNDQNKSCGSQKVIRLSNW